MPEDFAGQDLSGKNLVNAMMDNVKLFGSIGGYFRGAYDVPGGYCQAKAGRVCLGD
jgi:hypothetical protein